MSAPKKAKQGNAAEYHIRATTKQVMMELYGDVGWLQGMEDKTYEIIKKAEKQAQSEMVSALRLVARGFETGSLKSKMVIQFPEPGSKKRAATITSVESIVKKALRGALK